MLEEAKKSVRDLWGIPDAPEVTDVDARVINSGPAIFANKLYATSQVAGMRLTFAELNPGDPLPAFRTSVFLAYHDVAALIDLLQRQIAPVEAAIAQGREEMGG